MARGKPKSGIKIKAKNRGAYTKQSGGKVTSAKIHRDLRSKNPKTRARANFARMARRGWKPLSGQTSSPKKSHVKRTGKLKRVRGHTRVLSTGRRVHVKGHRRKG